MNNDKKNQIGQDPMEGNGLGPVDGNSTGMIKANNVLFNYDTQGDSIIGGGNIVNQIGMLKEKTD